MTLALIVRRSLRQHALSTTITALSDRARRRAC